MARPTINIMNRFSVVEGFVVSFEVSQLGREDLDVVTVIAAYPGSFRAPSNTLHKWHNTKYKQLDAIGKSDGWTAAEKVVHVLS